MSFFLGYWLIWAAIVGYVAIKHASASENGSALLLGTCLMLVIGPIMVPLMLINDWRDSARVK
jgi:type IV secretory pathway VirB6-like protein